MPWFTLKKSATSLRAEQEAAERLHYDYRITWYLLYCGFWAAFLHLTGGGRQRAGAAPAAPCIGGLLQGGLVGRPVRPAQGLLVAPCVRA